MMVIEYAVSIDALRNHADLARSFSVHNAYKWTLSKLYKCTLVGNFLFVVSCKYANGVWSDHMAVNGYNYLQINPY